MRFTLSLGSAIAAAAAPLILAACSSGAAQVSPSAAQGAVAPLAVSAASSALNKNSHLRIVDLASVKAQVDVAQYSSGPTFPGVTEYAAHNKKNGPPFCEIGGLVQVIGIETDASGNLWVPQQATIDGPGEVIEYAPDCGTAGTKLSVPNGWAVDLGFAKNGTIYVSTDLGPVGEGPGYISVYPAGATAPSGELTNPAVLASEGVAVDPHGNVFQSYEGNPGGVVEFEGGTGSGTILTGINIAKPQYLFLDKHNDLAVIDGAATKLDTYAPPYTALTSSFPLKGVSSQCAVNKAENNVACADYQYNAIDVYAYPSGTYQYSFDSGLSDGYTFGIAQDPR